MNFIAFRQIYMLIRFLHDYNEITMKLEAPVKGWTQGRESETPGVRTPLCSPVLHCIVSNRNLKQNVLVHFAYTGKVYVYILLLPAKCTKCTEINFFQCGKQRTMLIFS